MVRRAVIAVTLADSNGISVCIRQYPALSNRRSLEVMSSGVSDALAPERIAMTDSPLGARNMNDEPVSSPAQRRHTGRIDPMLFHPP
mgnify:CR=1 FL=1